MVYLTITHAIAEAIQKCKVISSNEWSSERHDDDSSLEAPTLGKPISHLQVIAISKFLRQHKYEQCTLNLRGSPDSPNFHLDTLLRGARIYMEPPQLKTEPVRIAPHGLHLITDCLFTDCLFTRHRSTKR